MTIQVERRFVTRNKKAAPTLGPQISDFVIDDYVSRTPVFPRRDEIPKGAYHSKITSVTPVLTAKDMPALDVAHELEGEDGSLYYILQRYPQGSCPLNEFYMAMLSAGIPKGSYADVAVGIEEQVYLDFVADNSDIGSFTKREPYTYFDGDSDKLSFDEE